MDQQEYSNMNTAEYQYLQIIKEILDNGEWKDPARPGMPRTKEVFFRTMTFDLEEGYPCFTTKKMAFKSCITELTWFLKGDTNVRYLLENGCNIWTDDAYKHYVRHCKKEAPVDKDTWKQWVLDRKPWSTVTRYVVDKEGARPVVEARAESLVLVHRVVARLLLQIARPLGGVLNHSEFIKCVHSFNNFSNAITTSSNRSSCMSSPVTGKASASRSSSDTASGLQPS